MARVQTNKVINLTQLGIELGRVSVRSVAVVFVESDAVTDAVLSAAVQAHAADPNYVDPNAAPPPPDPDVAFREALTAATTVAQLRDALLGNAGPGAQARNRP